MVIYIPSEKTNCHLCSCEEKRLTSLPDLSKQINHCVTPIVLDEAKERSRVSIYRTGVSCTVVGKYKYYNSSGGDIGTTHYLFHRQLLLGFDDNDYLFSETDRPFFFPRTRSGINKSFAGHANSATQGGGVALFLTFILFLAPFFCG